MMKERPILFSGPMVRAILEGRKTQTRRVGQIQNSSFVELGVEYSPHAKKGLQAIATHRAFPGQGSARHGICECPYGIPGNRLWVREAWTPDHAAFYPNFPIVYRADRGYEYERNERGEVYSPEQKAWYPYRWRPSIHMPRWASRITLEITGVRVERLQEISDDDCRAEGCCHRGWNVTDWKHPHNESGWNIERANFASLWSSINGPESWIANPWVWVIEFRRVTE